MPDPTKKISTPTLNTSESNVICTASNKSVPIEPKDDCINPCKVIVKEEATVSKTPKEDLCPVASPTCQLARPEINPKARVDKTKSGCIDFEKCEDDEDDEEPEVETGCPNFENFKELDKEEKQLKKKEKEKATGENKPCPM